MSSGSRTVLITGASSGIGRATAQRFAREGWRIGLVSRDEEGLEEVRRDVDAAGGSACVAPADVTDPEALAGAAARVEGALGPIEVWVNGAGISVIAPFTEISVDEFRRVTDTTYMGTVNGVRVALSHMLPRDRGTIVNVASAIAYRGVPLQTPYSGAKYAIRGFTEALRSELIHDRSQVHLTMVHPPSVNTPFFGHAPKGAGEEVPRPPPPAYQPELIADAIYFAAHARRREVMVGGQTVQMALLNKVAPGVADWLFGQIGYAMQRTRKQAAIGERDPELFAPSGETRGVRGPWNAFEHSPQLWATRNRGLVATGLAAAGLLVLAARSSGKSGRRS